MKMTELEQGKVPIRKQFPDWNFAVTENVC